MQTKQLPAFLLATALCLMATACGSPAAGAPEQSAASGNGSAKANVEGKIEGEITVSCYDTMQYKSFLDAAAKAFEGKYPGVKVNVETFSAMPEIKTMEQDGMKIAMVQKEDDPQGRGDYISKIATELMSGKGADVLAMDVLPYYKYAENGQLEDLSKYMQADPDFNISDYRENIFKAAQYKNGQYLVPLDYSFNYFAYDSSLLNDEAAQQLQQGDAFTFEQLANIGGASFEAAKDADPPAKMFGYTGGAQNGGSMISQLLEENYHSFVDVETKAVSFNDGRFESLLELAKEYAQKGYLRPSMQNQEEPVNIRDVMSANQSRYFFKSNSNMNLLSYFNKDSQVNVRISTGGDAGNEENDEIAGIAANGNGEATFTYSQAYGINSNSSNKATAWAFVKFLLSEQIQSSPQLSPAGLPVNNNARMERAKTMITGGMFTVAMGDEAMGGKAANADAAANATVELDDKQQGVYEQYTAAIERFSDKISAYQIKDTTIDSIIDSEVKAFFDGTKSAKDVANVLQNKIELYINE